MQALQEQITELEAENIAKKDWTLMGEATSRSRPQNSLLEEDLEFERVMKAVPVVTEEVVQSLEERIKTRILENQFDDVVRRRAVDDKPFLPSRFFELKDTKSTQSLAQIYEDEYTATQTGGVAGEDRDGKLKKEHDELETIWDGICAKLDALSNTHFTPKPVSTHLSSLLNERLTYSTSHYSLKLRSRRCLMSHRLALNLLSLPPSLRRLCLLQRKSLRLRPQRLGRGVSLHP